MAPTLFDVAWLDRSPFAAGLVSAEQPALAGLPGAPVYHLELWIGDSQKSLAGTQQVYVTNNEAVALDALYFRLYAGLLGGSITMGQAAINGRPVTTALESEGTALRLPLAPPLEPGQAVVVSLEFSAEVPDRPGVSYGAYALIDNILSLAHFYPQLAVYDQSGWNTAVPSANADVVYADPAFYLVRVDAPAGLLLAASGVEVERSEADGRQQATFAAGPARDFFLVGSGDYVLASRQVGETTINSYALGQYAAHGEALLEFAAAALASFNSGFGPYPYTELEFAGTTNLALGIEYPGIMVITTRLYDPAAEIGGLPSLAMMEATVAHETGHQWFYNAIGNDQVDEPWLDESLTQYATYLYYLDEYGEAGAEGFRQSFFSRWDRANRELIPVGLPAGAYEGADYGAIVYGRGPLFFEALSETMGPEGFNRFLADYSQAFRWQTVTTEALKQLAESHCGCDLTPLFTEWIYAPAE
jgi:hypothetical protein